MKLLEFTDKGIYCEKADVFIDPWKPVKRALVTHAHSDHARFGNSYYMTQHGSVPIMKYRLGSEINIEGLSYGEVRIVNGVSFSFHPAGHIPGSAQVRVEYKGNVWVVSGDYKLEDDKLSTAFEPVKCDTFITECTFGLPIYIWPDQEDTYAAINAWWKMNKERGITSVIGAYALGKAQRIINALDVSIGKIFTHGAVQNTNEVLRAAGFQIQDTTLVTPEIDKRELKGNIIIATPSAMNSTWMSRFNPFSTALASGWMAVRGARRRRSVDRGFVLSDHADWAGLNQAIKETGAERIVTTHGYTDIFSRWLMESGYEASVENTAFEGESLDVSETTNEPL